MRRDGGAGLGRILVRAIVDRVHSRGVGATFYCPLLAAEATPRATAPVVINSKQPDFKSGLPYRQAPVLRSRHGVLNVTLRVVRRAVWISGARVIASTYNGLAELLKPALRAAPTTKRLIASRTFWQAKNYQNYLFHTTPRDRFMEKSSYIHRTIPDSGFETVMEWVQRWPASLNSDGGGTALFGWGGAINRLAPSETAFVHRDALFLMAYATSWTAKDSAATVSAGLDWIEKFFAAMKPYVAPRSYQNFLDPNLGSWKRAYYGDNLERLERVKRRYDPGNRFRFAQSIPRA